MTPLSYAAIAAGAVLAAGCAIGPDYQEPDSKLEKSFKNAGFAPAPPEGSWWTLFHDPELDRLIAAAEADSPTARAALARYDGARAALGLAQADAYPAITGDAYGLKKGDSQNANFSQGTYADYRAALNLEWEIDLWGRVRRSVGMAVAEMDATGYEYQSALLSLRGEVARAYLSMRFADAEIALLEQTEELRREARRLMEARFRAGASSQIDHERSITEHEAIVSELQELRAQRSRFENALAALVGRSASGFSLGARSSPPTIPAVPGSVPSELLRRRPDLAAAERRLAAASDQIGFAIASYLPRISITGAGGLRSLRASQLFDLDSGLWEIGPQIDIPFFQGGRGVSDFRRAEAAYKEALELYREALVGAVRDTEDSMSDARRFASAGTSRQRGSTSAQKAADLVRKRYEAGSIDYFEVVDSERTSINEQRAALNIELNRALATTRLIQALGGGWTR